MAKYNHLTLLPFKGFRWRLDVVVDDRMSFSSEVKRLQARGAATENARSPNRRSVHGRKRLLLLEARLLMCRRPVWASQKCSLLNDRWVSCGHSLYSIRYAMVSQCNSRRARVAWWRGFRSSTSLAAALSALCSGANVAAERLARTALQ